MTHRTSDRMTCYCLLPEDLAGDGPSLAGPLMIPAGPMAIRQQTPQPPVSASSPALCHAPYADVEAPSTLPVRAHHLPTALTSHSLPVENGIDPHCFSVERGRTSRQAPEAHSNGPIPRLASRCAPLALSIFGENGEGGRRPLLPGRTPISRGHTVGRSPSSKRGGGVGRHAARRTPQ